MSSPQAGDCYLQRNWAAFLMDHSWPLFLYFRLFYTVDSKCSTLILPMTGFELWTLLLKATALQTESQPLPLHCLSYLLFFHFEP